MAVEVVGGASEKVEGAEQGNEGEQMVWQGELTSGKVAEGFWGDESPAWLLVSVGGLVGGWDLIRYIWSLFRR